MTDLLATLKKWGLLVLAFVVAFYIVTLLEAAFLPTCP